MRIAVLGNSGSGKSTLAHWFATRGLSDVLDLDTVAWSTAATPTLRAPEEAIGDVLSFCAARRSWIVEGCYAHLIGASLALRPRLIFLNPGAAQCLANCRSRPWEPHKYATREAQDERLAFLLNWVQEYYVRDGDLSLKAHEALFTAYDGPKAQLTAAPRLEAPPPDLLAWAAES